MNKVKATFKLKPTREILRDMGWIVRNTNPGNTIIRLDDKLMSLN